MTTGGVYQIRNTVTGHVYIGASNNIRARCATHKCALRNGKHSSKRLQAAWDTHGQVSFEFSTLEVVDDMSIIGQRERHWITVLEADNPEKGYNRYKGQFGAPGQRAPLSPDLVRRMAAASAIRWSDPDYKARTSQSISLALKGLRTGKKHSPETLAKITAANRARAHLQVGVPLKPETIAKLVKARRGTKRSQATKDKMSKARAEWWSRLSISKDPDISIS